MKKLVIFLILFIFTMPAFAQGESSFTENFSLIRDSGADNQSFFNLNILCPGDHLFFTENRRYSRLHRAFQVFRFFRFSDLTPLSNIVAVEDGRQRWGDTYNLLYGQRGYINPEEESESLAEGYLKRLAKRSKRSRKTWGTIWLVGGGAFMASGVALLSSAKDNDWWGGFWEGLFGAMAITSGAVMAGVGIYKLAIPSGAERELDDLLSISDPGHRERASHVALSSLAARGRRKRIFWGILCAGFSAYALFSEEGSPLIAAEYGGFAVYNLMRKSRAERAFQSYLQEKEFQNRLEFRVGILPYGGVKVGLVYSF